MVGLGKSGDQISTLCCKRTTTEPKHIFKGGGGLKKYRQKCNFKTYNKLSVYFFIAVIN